MNVQLIRIPLSKADPIYILDSSPGSGMWMADVAQQYIDAAFVGTDIHARHLEQLKDLVGSLTFETSLYLNCGP